jgi:hypothetical protein
LLAALNFALFPMLAGNTGPLPVKFGFGNLSPCAATQLANLVIAASRAARNFAAFAPVAPARNVPVLPPQAFNAAANFGLPAKPRAVPDRPEPNKPPPPPPAGGAPPPVGPVPVGPVPVPGRRKRPPFGSVTPWAFRQATSFVRAALPVPLDADAVPELAPELALELVLELDPQAATTTALARTAASSAVRRMIGVVLCMSLFFVCAPRRLSRRWT